MNNHWHQLEFFNPVLRSRNHTRSNHAKRNGNATSLTPKDNRIRIWLVQRGGAPLPDLLLARRTLGELQLDAADLDLFTFRLSVARSRAAGELPPFPDSAPHVP